MSQAILGRRKLLLPCILTEGELEERQSQLVQFTKSRELREQALQRFKDDKKSEQKVLEADVMHVATECFRLAGIIEKGIEPREVDCEDVLMDPPVNVFTARLDTGEIVSTRPATEGDRQAALPLGE